MPPIDRAYAGAAVQTTTTTTFTPTVPGVGQTFVVADDTGYPVSGNIPIKLNKGLSDEEHVLATRVGTTFTIVQRGYDGTSAQAHTSPTTVEIYWDARTANLVVEHTDGVEADPHSTKLLNNARHDLPARHGFGASAALGLPALPTTLTPDAGNDAGTGDNPAREDHRHDIPAASASTITGANAEGSNSSFPRSDHNHAIGGTNHIPGAALVDGSVTALQIATGAIANGGDLATGQRLYYTQASDPGAVGADLLWWNTTTRTLLVRNAGNTAWEVLSGTSAWMTYTPAVFNITLGNGVRFGRYIRLGRIIVGNIFFWIGTTTVFGTNIGFGLPANASDLDSFVGYPGVATNEFFSHGASRGTLAAAGVYAAVGVVAQAGPSKAVDRVNFFATAGSAAWGAGVPGAWGNPDRLSVFFEYEVANAEDANYD